AAGSGNTTGTLTWTPGYSQAGSYTVTFTASNALSGSANTVITVNNVDRAPVVTAPLTVGAVVGKTLKLNITAVDPDGEAINSLTASGLPGDATFTVGSGNASGTMSWTPQSGDEGTYHVTFTASNSLTASATTAIRIVTSGAPTVTSPATATVAENSLLTVNVTASDPNGDPIASLAASGLPPGATFTAGSGNTSG